MLQLTSRRFLRELDETPGENSLQYILKCPCIPSFGNQGLHNEIMLGGNGGCSGVICEGSPYSGRAITHQVEANVYYKGHVKRMRMDVCNLGKTEVILEIPWLQTHNPEINWKTKEVKMTRCLPLCGRTRPRGVEKGKRIATLKEEKIIR